MTVCDTSILVAAFSTWHQQHLVAHAALEASARLLGHVGFETLSVLTRMPEPYRADAATVREFLREWYPGRPLVLTATQTARALDDLADAAVTGGAVYDGLVALAAAAHGHRLVSLDKRAKRTYVRLGVDHTVLPE